MCNRLVFVLLSLVILPSLGEARSGMSMKRFRLTGYYGVGFIAPDDVNQRGRALGGTPVIPSINQDTYYGGTLGIMVTPRFGMHVEYETHTASNPVTQTSPNGSDSGMKISQQEVWVGPVYYLINTGRFYTYLGASAGYPLGIKVTQKQANTTTEFDADKTLGFKGNMGVGFFFGAITLYLEGGYQSLDSGDVKSAAGVVQTVNGRKMAADLSGGRVNAGLGFVF
jgi:hypothetical protein